MTTVKTHRSKKAIKLYAVKDAKGRFKDIQTIERKHRKSLKQPDLKLNPLKGAKLVDSIVGMTARKEATMQPRPISAKHAKKYWAQQAEMNERWGAHKCKMPGCEIHTPTITKEQLAHVRAFMAAHMIGGFPFWCTNEYRHQALLLAGVILDEANYKLIEAVKAELKADIVDAAKRAAEVRGEG